MVMIKSYEWAYKRWTLSLCIDSKSMRLLFRIVIETSTINCVLTSKIVAIGRDPPNRRLYGMHWGESTSGKRSLTKLRHWFPRFLPHGTCALSVPPIFSFRWYLVPPNLNCIPKPWLMNNLNRRRGLSGRFPHNLWPTYPILMYTLTLHHLSHSLFGFLNRSAPNSLDSANFLVHLIVSVTDHRSFAIEKLLRHFPSTPSWVE